jgi:hypothetical protein
MGTPEGGRVHKAAVQQEESAMLKRLSYVHALACAACATPQAAPDDKVRRIRIYNAHVLQGEYGTAVDDPNCLTGGFMVKIDPALEGSEFIKVLRYGRGKLGPSFKYVIIDGVVETAGELGDRAEVTLVRVDSLREQIINAPQYVELSEANLGCEKDSARQKAWLRSLQRKPRDH